MEPDLVQWVKDLKPMLAKKLARVGLIPEPEAKAATTLGAFLKSYIDGRADLKPATKIVRGQVIRDLKNSLANRGTCGPSRRAMRTTSSNRWSAGSWHRPRFTSVCKSARSFFHAMRRRKLIDENPFDGVKAAATGIKDRQRFVTRGRNRPRSGGLPRPSLAERSLPWPATAACGARREVLVAPLARH